MSNKASANSESKYDREFWKELSPEELLGVLLHQLRNPIFVIRGWTNLLGTEEAKEHHRAAAENIAERVTQLEKIHEALGQYLRDRTRDE